MTLSGTHANGDTGHLADHNLIDQAIAASVARDALLAPLPTTARNPLTSWYHVKGYGAVGDGVTDDTAAIQAAITAAQAGGGGTVIFEPLTYKTTGTLTVDPSTLSGPIVVWAYGSTISYTGSSDAFKVLTNIISNTVYSHRALHTYGLHIVGTSAATAGIRNYGATACTWTDTVLDGFTNLTTQCAALVLDARFNNWVESNHFSGMDIRNTGNGICFISEGDSNGVAASCMNNVYNAVQIWCTTAGGKGLYGVGLGGTTLVQIARSVFNGVVVHPSANNVIGWDLTSCYVEGAVLNGPSVDVLNTPTGLIGFKYTLNDALVVIGATCFPYANVQTPITGGGNWVIIGGNIPSPQAKTVYPTVGVQSSNSTTWPANNMSVEKIIIDTPTTLTGITVINGATVAGNVLVGLFNYAGVKVAGSASAVQTGTFASQPVPFTSTYSAKPGVYYKAVIPSSASATWAQAVSFMQSNGQAQGSFALPTSMTPPGSVGSYIIASGTY